MYPSNLRETPAAVKWMKQFDTIDRVAAAELIDGLRLVSGTQFTTDMMGGLRDLLYSLKTSNSGESTAAFFASRESQVHHSPYFHLEDATVPPAPTGSGRVVGSEALIAHLLRDLSIEDIDHWYSHPPIRWLRDTRTRNWIVVDDLIATGTRGLKMIDWMYDHPTVKSWLSGGRITIHYFAFAGTAEGIGRIRSHRAKPRVVALYTLPYGSRAWPNETGSKIEGLCRQYASRHLPRANPLGYKGAFTNIVFEHGCPNTAPAILHQQSDSWTPLFEIRPSTGFLSWPNEIDPVIQHSRILRVARQGQLSQAITSELLGESDRLLILALALGSRHRGRSEVLSELLEVTVGQAELLITKCQDFGWLSDRYHLTDVGRAILNQARLLQRTDKKVPLKTQFYIPHTISKAEGI